jgi:hypothetical protein
MNKLNKSINNLASYSSEFSKINPEISEANIGWHIVHSCLVITSVTKTIVNSDPSNFKKKFSFKAFYVLLFKKFPRGKAKAPTFTHPQNELTESYIREVIQEARKSLDHLSRAASNQYFTHPIFGDLQLRKAIKFLGVHTYHHEKIIRDILK